MTPSGITVHSYEALRQFDSYVALALANAAGLARVGPLLYLLIRMQTSET